MGRSSLYMSLSILLVSVGVVFVLAQTPTTESKAGARNAEWKPGTWWITETQALEKEPYETLGDPSQTIQYVYRHKWSMVKEDKIGDLPVWVVEIRPIGLPSDIVNDLGESPLYTLSFDKSLSIPVRFEADIRGGRYCVSGKGEHFEKSFAKVPVVWQGPVGATLPFRFPLMRWPWLTAAADRHVGPAVLSDYENRDTKKKIEQSLLWFRNQSKRGELGCVADVKYAGTTYTSVWAQSCPWWVEWRSSEHGDIWWSRTVDWSGRSTESSPATQPAADSRAR